MLSIYTLKSASQASLYYEQGDYYIKGDSVENNVWFGKGAEELGLVGSVDAKQFKALLEGKLPNGVVLNNGYDKDGKPQHRPGYDLTFSACKSASILAIVSGDTRIVHAHINAVKSALTMIENEMAATRLKKDGVVEVAKTNNIVAALFNHTDSRLLDPNLHTHCILLNITKVLDEWRTLYGDDFYNCKMALGLAYRMFFAQGLMKIGYEIEQTTKNGLFEIANFPKEVITFFSKRRVEIEKGIEDTGRDASDKISITVNKGTKFEKIVNTTVSSMVTLYSRAKKRTLHKDELQQHWTQQLHQAGCERSTLDNIIAQSKAMSPIQPDNPVKTLSDAFPLAIEHLTSSRHMFTEKDLCLAIKGLCLKSNVSDTQIQSAIQALKERGSILLGSNGLLTTKDAQNIERENIDLVVKAKGSSSALLPIVASMLVKHFVKDESKVAPLTNILSAKSRFLGLEGSNERQTNDLLRTLVKLTPYCTHYVLSKNHKTAIGVAKDIGAGRAFSTHEFISYTNRLVADKNIVKNYSAVWIINRSQQLSHLEVNRLLKNAQSLGAKILFTGDSFESTIMQQANAFKQLIDNQLPTVTLQSNMQLAPNLIKDSQLVQALDTMESNQKITYIGDAKQRFDTVCAYIATQDAAVLLVQNKAMALTANNLIRELKIANGSIHGVALQAQVLAPISLSAQERTLIVSFNAGDIIRFNSDIQNTSFKQGAYYTITSINEKNNSISLNSGNAETNLNFTSSLGEKLAFFRPQTLEIRVGDNLAWNDYTPFKINAYGASKGDSLMVVGIQDNTLQVLGRNGIKTLDLHNNIAKHIDYNYAKTISTSNAQQNINGAILIEPNSFPAVAPQDLYSALKSFDSEPTIFSTDRGELLQSLEGNNQKLDSAISATALTVDSKTETIQAQEPTVNPSATTAVEYAIAKLSEREAVFRKCDLEYIAFGHDIKTKVSDLEQAITQLETNGTLIKVDKDNYVFKEIYDCERTCLDVMERGAGKLQAILNPQDQALGKVDANTMLTIGQKEAISTIITATDRVTLVQGVAGSGKTTMLKEVKSIARDNGYELIGLANTASAKLNLHLKSIGAEYNSDNPSTFVHAGMPSQTLTSFLLMSEKMLDANPDIAKAAYPPNTILVLDEASLVGAKAMKSLLNVTEKLDLRLVVIGDDRQLPAIEASRIFSLMLGTSNSAVNMNINTRLQTPESLEIMQLIYASNLNPNLLDKAFEQMQLNIVEIPDKTERLQLMANYYTSMPQAKRDDILPMMPENKDRVMFNNLVRENLKKDGTLTGPALSTQVMVAKDLTTTEKHYALSFDKGDFVRFNSNIARLNIKAGDYYQVLDTNLQQLILRNDAGVTTSWNPFRHARGNVETYRQQVRDVMAGDVIRWRRNFEDKGMINGDTAKVLSVKDNVLTVQLANGKQHEINTKDRNNQHFDHAYGSTVHVAQGLDKPNPIGLLDGPKPYKQESAAVAVGSVVVVPGNPRENATSKVAQVISNNINGDINELMVVDREGRKQSLNTKFVDVYPDFDKTRHHPLANICNFLVQATRGDDFIVFVDNVEGYTASLKHSLDHLKQTAFEMINVQKGLEIKTKVAQMTSQVFGLAKPDELKKRLLAISSKSKLTPSTTQKLKLNFEKNRDKLTKDQFHHQLDSLKQTINQDPLRFATQILGAPVTKTQSYANFAMGKDQTKGNLTLDIAGHKAGLWCDHRSGEGGDLVSLYAKHYGLNYIDAAKKLFSERNIKEIVPSALTKAKLATNKLQQKNEELARTKSITIAAQLYNSAQPVADTLAEKYLSNMRGIKCGIPSNFKFSPLCWHKDLRTQKPALLIPAFDENGKLQSVNRIYIGPDANKLNIMVKSSSDTPMQATQKAVLGPSRAATVFINKVPGSPVTYLTEGVENALSIRQTISNANISSCFGIGQLKNVSLSTETKTVVICADNDGANLATKQALVQTISKFLDAGLEVKLALPLDRDPSAKYDYNQMLTDRGVAAITTSISQAVHLKNISDLGGDKTPLHQSFSRLHEQQFSKNIGPVSKVLDIERER